MRCPLQPESFPALTSAPPYVPPVNFAARNAQLIASIKKAINNSEPAFADFKKVSMQYRQGEISAQAYYSDFNRICGPEAARIFPELVALLPDSGKQEQLLQVYG